MSDIISFEAIKNEDIKAFETLFQEFYPSLCVFALHYVEDATVAEDIAQEAFVKLWEKRNVYESIPCLKTFLYVSVKNLCLNYIRDRKETIDYTSPVVEKQEFTFENKLIEEETYRILTSAVNALPPQSAKIIKLSLDGKQLKEISEILNISVNTVKTLKYNAINILKTSLKDYFYILLLLLLQK